MTAGDQYRSGTGFALVNGADTTLVNTVKINYFGNQNEHYWPLRHDYYFAVVGFPGLNPMNRYLSGSNGDRGVCRSEDRTG